MAVDPEMVSAEDSSDNLIKDTALKNVIWQNPVKSKA